MTRVRRWHPSDGTPSERRLNEVHVGESCRVARVGRHAELLAGFCIYPGARLEVRQQVPALVIAAQGFEFALENDLAEEIWVAAPRDETS